MNVIEIKNMTKDYGQVKGIDNISLNVEKGLIYGFVGQNGAGKSTTIRCLLNMIFPTEGVAKIFNYDCIKDTKKIKQTLSYVPGEVNYYPSMKVSDLFDYALSFIGKNKKDKVDNLCKYFELDKKRYIRELSLGNRKKVSLIQALLKEPELIILDEPTSGLDPLIQDKLFKLLLEEKEKGTTIFLSSHNLTEVEKYCDKVCVIKKGRIVKISSLKEIKENKKQRISFVTEKGEEKSYIFDGDINKEIRKLSATSLKSLEIKNISLEEEFMHFYQEDENEK